MAALDSSKVEEKSESKSETQDDDYEDDDYEEDDKSEDEFEEESKPATSSLVQPDNIGNLKT